ncbi:hypothetical protein [Nonlabens antarcticus]|uniref:hypothetical protein n=1 Tax=Nonlabens antarcticus TaxID=392714 RepID=UPI001891533A|nr:hypothetical protein [Nonlabens antarcticus]
MSFFEREPTAWNYSNKNNVLEFKDHVKWKLIMQFFLMFWPLIYVGITAYLEGGIIWIILISIFGTLNILFISISIKTVSLATSVDIESIEGGIIKGNSHTRIHVKLKNGRCRQLYFVTRPQFESFASFLHDHNIPVQERSKYFSLPLNY